MTKSMLTRRSLLGTTLGALPALAQLRTGGDLPFAAEQELQDLVIALDALVLVHGDHHGRRPDGVDRRRQALGGRRGLVHPDQDR